VEERRRLVEQKVIVAILDKRVALVKAEMDTLVHQEATSEEATAEAVAAEAGMEAAPAVLALAQQAVVAVAEVLVISAA
jgi:hypothetical protein